MHLVMQGYADRLNDEEVAELANFLRTGWGNQASKVSASDVAKQRKKAVTADAHGYVLASPEACT